MDCTHVVRIGRWFGRRAEGCAKRADGAALSPPDSGGKPPHSKADA
jgi:hypothetical protein